MLKTKSPLLATPKQQELRQQEQQQREVPTLLLLSQFKQSLRYPIQSCEGKRFRLIFRDLCRNLSP
jgi:hypothetical protein